MLDNCRVQLNVAGYEFYGQAELPQQAKHNAAVQVSKIKLARVSERNYNLIFPGITHCQKPSGPYG